MLEFPTHFDPEEVTKKWSSVVASEKPMTRRQLYTIGLDILRLRLGDRFKELPVVSLQGPNNSSLVLNYYFPEEEVYDYDTLTIESDGGYVREFYGVSRRTVAGRERFFTSWGPLSTVSRLANNMRMNVYNGVRKVNLNSDVVTRVGKNLWNAYLNTPQ